MGVAVRWKGARRAAAAFKNECLQCATHAGVVHKPAAASICKQYAACASASPHGKTCVCSSPALTSPSLTACACDRVNTPAFSALFSCAIKISTHWLVLTPPHPSLSPFLLCIHWPSPSNPCAMPHPSTTPAFTSSSHIPRLPPPPPLHLEATLFLEALGGGWLLAELQAAQRAAADAAAVAAVL
jgi:hypothetical protein